MISRPDAELRALSGHVLWHVQMLFSLSRLLEQRAQRAGQWLFAPEDAALLEAFAVHARALIEFLWRDKALRKTDGRAAHYFEPGEWSKLRPAMETTLDEVFDRASWGVVHISYRRAFQPDEARQWRFAQIAASIGRCLRVFLDHVPRNRVEPRFVEEAWAHMPPELRAPVALSWPADDSPGPVATPATQHLYSDPRAAGQR